MNRKQFGEWITKNHQQLLKVAGRRRFNGLDTEELLQTAVVGMLASKSLAAKTKTEDDAWKFAWGFIRGSASHARRSESRRSCLNNAMKDVRRAGSVLSGSTGGGKRVQAAPGSDDAGKD